MILFINGLIFRRPFLTEFCLLESTEAVMLPTGTSDIKIHLAGSELMSTDPELTASATPKDCENVRLVWHVTPGPRHHPEGARNQ